MNYCNLDQLVADLRLMQERDQFATLLIGAGCSFTAGIPTAKGFVKRIKSAHRTATVQDIVSTWDTQDWWSVEVCVHLGALTCAVRVRVAVSVCVCV